MTKANVVPDAKSIRDGLNNNAERDLFDALVAKHGGDRLTFVHEAVLLDRASREHGKLYGRIQEVAASRASHMFNLCRAGNASDASDVFEAIETIRSRYNREEPNEKRAYSSYSNGLSRLKKAVEHYGAGWLDRINDESVSNFSALVKIPAPGDGEGTPRPTVPVISTEKATGVPDIATDDMDDDYQTAEAEIFAALDGVLNTMETMVASGKLDSDTMDKSRLQLEAFKRQTHNAFARMVHVYKSQQDNAEAAA